ncbi:hypothetical protein J6TS7_11660 [Paenibacillus dendritiformis]|nr:MULTISPECIES: hypothetical protein [Paenibacillus]GIO77556.1 hypothetical protein J6TS7_11660 [Paenibacillus dendritiformis]
MEKFKSLAVRPLEEKVAAAVRQSDDFLIDMLDGAERLNAGEFGIDIVNGEGDTMNESFGRERIAVASTNSISDLSAPGKPRRARRRTPFVWVSVRAPRLNRPVFYVYCSALRERAFSTAMT